MIRSFSKVRLTKALWYLFLIVLMKLVSNVFQASLKRQERDYAVAQKEIVDLQHQVRL